MKKANIVLVLRGDLTFYCRSLEHGYRVVVYNVAAVGGKRVLRDAVLCPEAPWKVQIKASER